MGLKDKDEKKTKKKKIRKPAQFDAETAQLDSAEDISPETTETASAPSESETAPAPEPLLYVPEEPKRKRRKWPIVLIIILVILAIFVILPRILGFNRIVTESSGYETHTVTRGNMTVTLSGSGTLQPADKYTITPLLSGEIISAPFEEGDIVEKDDVLYTVDSSDVASSIQQAENSLEDAQRNYDNAVAQREDLNMTAGGTGTVIALDVQIGDTVTTGQTLATIRNAETMTFTALYQCTIAEQIHNGDDAVVSLSETFETYPGTVTDVSPVDTVLSGGIIAREVTIEIENPGALSTSYTPGATISGNTSITSSNLEYKYEGAVTATMTGIIDALPVQVGSTVTKGQTIAVLHSDTIEQQIESAQSTVRDAKLALENQTANLDDYTIRSPIAGTIVEKYFKEGDTLETGSSVCTIFDLSYLTLTLNVDELDIKKVAVGQPVAITADASEDTEYEGVVTKININGTTLNGVTSYPVTIRIDETEGLLPGMNVDATITVSSLENVVMVPVGALLRGNFVLLKSDAYDPDTAETGIPEGYIYTEVTPGASNDAYVVISEGLSEGDVIALEDTTPTSYDSYPFMMDSEQRAGGFSSGEAG